MEGSNDDDLSQAPRRQVTSGRAPKVATPAKEVLQKRKPGRPKGSRPRRRTSDMLKAKKDKQPTKMGYAGQKKAGAKMAKEGTAKLSKGKYCS